MTPPSRPTAWYRASKAPALHLTVRGDKVLVKGAAARDAMTATMVEGQWSPAAKGWVVDATQAQDLAAWASVSGIRYTSKKEAP